jgi:murein DD-endopeptidase MepM/ murein hydrolase activator NlpD
MFSPERILDRGRILIGMLVIVPLGALAPAVGGPRDNAGPSWAITASTPNPLDLPAATPQDVLAKLTNPTVESPLAPSTAAQPQAPGAQTASPAVPTPSAGDEVGSERTDEDQPALDATAVAAGQTPSATPPPTAAPGPPPVATLTVTAYPVPKDTLQVFPVAGGATFTDDFGDTRAGGAHHQGIDLFATSGTPVIAVSDGVVSRVGWNTVGGWRLWLRDTWGNELYYAHLAAYAPGINDGATVRAGTVLGVVGNSGDAATASPHLHFEVHPHGDAPVSPFAFVSVWPRV